MLMKAKALLLRKGKMFTKWQKRTKLSHTSVSDIDLNDLRYG